MHIPLTLYLPVELAVVLENKEKPSSMDHKSFQHNSVYKIVSEYMLMVTFEHSDAKESGAGYIYPRWAFHATLHRRYSYYIVNVALPLAILTFLAGLSAGAIHANGMRLATDERLSVTLTLLLTAVAYKFIVAAELPQISYLTAMDSYVLCCFFFMFLVTVENVVWPAVVSSNHGAEPFDEMYIMLGYLLLFGLYNVGYAGRACAKLVERTKEWQRKFADCEQAVNSKLSGERRRQAWWAECGIVEEAKASPEPRPTDSWPTNILGNPLRTFI
jgi:hypothetical protein